MSWRATLGVQAGASHEEIRAAFKRRVLETHPDKGGKASEFRQVMLAFERATADSVGADVLKARGARWVRRAPKPRAKARPATTRPPQGRRRCPKNTAIMQKLHGYLKQLQRDDRRVTIATRLQQHHRLALEAWIQAQTMRGWHHEDAWPRQVASEEGDKREGSDTDESLEDLQPLALEDITPADAKVGRTMRPGPHKGIIRRPGRVRLYSVIVVISNIELFAASTTDLAAAVDVHMALTSLKQRISKRPELVRRLGEELELAMNDYAPPPDSVLLSFAVAPLVQGVSKWTLIINGSPYFFSSQPAKREVPIQRRWEQAVEHFYAGRAAVLFTILLENPLNSRGSVWQVVRRICPWKRPGFR